MLANITNTLILVVAVVAVVIKISMDDNGILIDHTFLTLEQKKCNQNMSSTCHPCIRAEIQVYALELQKLNHLEGPNHM